MKRLQLIQKVPFSPARSAFSQLRIFIFSGIPAFAYFFTLLSDRIYAADIWTQAETIMKDIYNQILGISTIAAIVTASAALLLMNFSKSGRTVDESRAWLKRIVISWAILNSMGFIMAYITPFFSNGQWNGQP